MFTEKFYGNILKEVLYLDNKTDFIKKGLDEEKKAGIRYALAETGLTEQQLVLLNLRFGCSMSYTESGDVVGISPSKARSSILSALESIRMSPAYVYFTNGFSEGERVDHYVDDLFYRIEHLSEASGYENYSEELAKLEIRYLGRAGVSKKCMRHLMKMGYHKLADIVKAVEYDAEKWGNDMIHYKEDEKIICLYTQRI